ncbi:MAG TPA: hypothetical protein PKC28_10890 [Bdellovibrionales bacterium]|nr:hypothetical protein [Bdellovibrionales bacterium]
MNLARVLTLVTALAIGLGLFQNCSNVALERQSTMDVLAASALGKACLDTDYTVESFYVTNLNALNMKNKVLNDSDMDGIPDDLEFERGFDPQRRRTAGVLDVICWNLAGNPNCAPNLPACSTVENPLGLSECDLKGMGLDSLYSHPVQGLDSDKDAIPDIVEILKGTLPNLTDNLADPDHDGLLNQDEIAQGSNPLFSDAAFPERWKMQAEARKTADANCLGEQWEFNVKRVPLISVMPFTDSPNGGPDLSHAQTENIILTTLKLRPKPGVTGSSKMLYNISRVSDRQQLVLTPTDFSNAGEMEP